jgi:hypothetical protein
MQSGTWTSHYALLGRSVGFNGRGRIFIGDTLLGRVPRLAIAASAGGRWWLMHCGRTWNVRTSFDYSSLEEAQAAAERRYPGSATRWLRTGYTRERAEAYVNRASRHRSCSFCGRRPDQIDEQMFVARKNAARVCDACVDRFAGLRARYRQERDEHQQRLLNTVSLGGPVRLILRSPLLVLLDLATFEAERTALASMAPLDHDSRREALAALARSRRIGVREIEPFAPGLYRVAPADLEPARRPGRDVVDVESGAVVVADLDALPAVAKALTRTRYEALRGNTDQGATASRLWKAFDGPRFAVLPGRPRRPFTGHGRFQLRGGAPALISAYD